jgi:hypothetical protein
MASCSRAVQARLNSLPLSDHRLQLSNLPDIPSLDGASSPEEQQEEEVHRDTHATESLPSIMVTNNVDSPEEPSAPLRNSSTKKTKKKRSSSSTLASQNGTSSTVFVPPKTTLAYNEYGELFDMEKVKRPQTSADLNVTETLRLIRKAYHHEVRYVRWAEYNQLPY